MEKEKIPGVKVQTMREDEHGNVYILLEEIRWLDLKIPAGYRSDGASVPRFFWRFVFPPGDVHALFAAFVHDYVYREHPDGWSKADADKLFLELLKRGGVAAWRARLAYYGVKFFGGASWAAGGQK